MGFFKKLFGGKQSAPSSHTPVEAKETGRSFQVLRMLEVLSEGEIRGLVDDMSSVYLDKTPLQNKDRTFNFKNVSVYMNRGTQNQGILSGFHGVEKEIDVSSKILKDKPITKTVTDTNVKRVRMTLGVERLLQQEANGDTNPTSVTMYIEILKNNQVVGAENYTIQGKYSNAYRERIEFRVPQAPFSIRVSRQEPDSTTSKLQNNCFWSSYTEIIEDGFTYPNTSVVGIQIDSEYFSQVPTRNYELYGLMVNVPVNYQPFSHTYSNDFWNGEFKKEWTNNPAWVFYDLVTNTRYGMGKTLKDFGIDKWQLYAIGRYCDELVPDGFGGTEPRMTCNIWLTEQRKAYDLINDLCSVFRAMPVWNGQALTAIQDRASDPVWTYNNANTIGGFTRQRSARKARHNTIHVEYVDASDFYEKKIESVSDDALVARYGENVLKVTAFGCTSRGQAYRTGRWILETEKLETETITFTVGQEGVMHLPYDVIEVADSQYAGVNVGGRVLAVNGTKVTLDRSITIDDNSYLSYVSAKGITENVKIISFDSVNNIASVVKSLDGIPELTVWGLTTKRISTGLYRAISIKENDSGEGKTYTITALQHVPQKESIVINGTHFDPKPQTIYGEIVDADIKQNGTELIISAKVNNKYNVLGSKAITSYTVKLSKNGALVYIKKGLSSPDIKLDDLDNGSYEAEISAYNEHSQLLNRYTRTFVIDRPMVVQNARADGGLGCIFLSWDYVDSITDTEIWASKVDDLTTAKLVTKLNGIMYTFECEGNETWYFWLRHTRGINLGSFGSEVGIKATSADDLKDVKELQKKIINEVIEVALPARKLELTKSVKTLPDPTVYQNARQIYVEDRGEMLVWNGTRYQSSLKEVQASAIKGILDINQLPEIPKAKITGKFTDNEIDSLSSVKLTGTIPPNLLSVPTERITGLLPSEKIQSIDVSKLVGTIPEVKLPSINISKVVGNINTDRLTGVLALNQIPDVPTNKLAGKITQTQLDTTLITQITTAKNTAESAKNELATVKRDLELEVQTRGTAITKLENADKELTKTITLLTAKANDALAGIEEEKGARARGDQAEATARNALITRVGNAESSISNLQRSVNSATTALSEVSQTLNAKIDKFTIGGRNLIRNSGTSITSNQYGQRYAITNAPAVGDDVVVTLYGDVGADRTGIGVYNSRGYDELLRLEKIADGVYQGKGKWALANGGTNEGDYADNTHLNLYFYPKTANSEYTINRIKFERGTVATDWTPASEDIEAELTDYKKAQATSEQALAERINGLNSAVGNVRSEVNIVSRTVADVKGKVESTYTIQTKTIAGGKTAIAGISLGTTEKESSVILMADKLQVVKNSTDSNPKTLLDVQENKVVLNGELFAKNGIKAEHILAGTITSREVKARSLTANEIQAGTITGNEIKARSIASNHIVANAVTANEIASRTITANQIATGTLTANEIKAGTITGNLIAGNTITGNLIQANSVEGDRIKVNTLRGDRIIANTIEGGAIKANSITGNLLRAEAIEGRHIKAGTITATQIAGNTITGNLIQAGTITGGLIASRSILAGNIQVGAIRADHLASGEITADKLAIGTGGNLLYNPILANDGEGWNRYAESNMKAPVHYQFRNKDTGKAFHANDTLEGENVLYMQTIAQKGSNFGLADPLYLMAKVNPEQWYIFSLYANPYGFSNAGILVEEYTEAGSYVKSLGFTKTPYKAGTAEKNIAGMSRYFIKFKAPTTGTVSLRFRCQGNIEKDRPDCYIARPMLEECTEYTAKPNNWQNAGLTLIHGGLIKTGTIHGDKLIANSITSAKIASRAITSDHIQTGSIDAKLLNVETLSAVSTNLGSINAGSIHILSRDGTTEFRLFDTGGFFLKARDSSGGIELSSQTRALKVWHGSLEVVRVGKLRD